MTENAITLDAADRRLLRALQEDCAVTNQALAARCALSPATCLRRVKRLVALGVIERQVALVSPQALGEGLTAIVEVQLERQDEATLAAFEAAVQQVVAVQQVYRVTAGLDFVLVVHARDMAAYRQWAQDLLTSALAVRNVKTYFSSRRSKFQPTLPVG